MNRVFVQAGPYNSYRGITEDIFYKYDYNIVTNLKDADIVVWTGGEDINPILYDEKPLQGTYFTSERDKHDLDAVDKAFSSNKFMVGICRGAQLLNVIPNEGKLWQDVDGHGGCTHKSFDCLKGEWVTLNSVHHQSLRLSEKGKLLTWAQESSVKKAENDIWTAPRLSDGIIKESDKDVEAAYYEDTRSFLFQGHPEFGHPETTEYFFGLMDKLYWNK